MGKQIKAYIPTKEICIPMLISDAEIQALPPKDKRYKHSFGRGLYLEIWPTGKKYWRLKYRLEGREKTYAIGVFPEVSLAAAVKATEDAKSLVRQHIDPVKVRRHIKQNPPPKSLFRLVLSHEGELTIETDI